MHASRAYTCREGDDGGEAKKGSGGTSSPVTETVMEVIEDMKALARDSDAAMTFGWRLSWEAAGD